MRHLKLRGKLGLNTAHREALLRNQLLALLKHERIQTTLVRAKQLQRYADQVIDIGKTNEWGARRKARNKVNDKEALQKLFDIYGPRFKDRNGGYTRIFQLGWRHGDGAPMGLIEILPDPAKENEPRIIKSRREKGKEATAEDLAQKKTAKKQKKKEKEEKEKTRKEKLKAAAEVRRARSKEDVAHSHVSQRRKTDKGTGRSKATKKGLS